MKNATIAYYMPAHLRQVAEQTQNQNMLEFCELFNLLGTDLCLIDRTGTITTPFSVHSLYPIPEQKIDVKSFEELCFDRAREILSEGKLIYLLYSGGIDSTCVLLSFHNVLKQKGDFSQIVIATTSEAQYENQAAWKEVVLQNYKLIHVCEMLGQIDLNSHKYIMGENGDQVFGSNQAVLHPKMMHVPYSKETLHKFFLNKVSKKSLERFHYEFSELANKCPLPIKWFRDFLWWLYFTCEWQSVAIRTLLWTNAFKNKISVAKLNEFAAFFNTISFQQLSLSGKINRWGSDFSPYSYKQTGRDFILKHTNWNSYVSEKMKAGSLFHALKQVSYKNSAIGYKKGYLFATELPQ